MKFKVEVTEIEGSEYFWGANSLEDAFDILKLFYGGEYEETIKKN